MDVTNLTELADRMEMISMTDLWQDDSALRYMDVQLANLFLPREEGAWLAFDHPWCNDYGDELAPDYTTSLDAVLCLLPDHATWVRFMNSQGKLAMCMRWSGVSGEGTGATPAIEMCVALLRAQAQILLDK